MYHKAEWKQTGGQEAVNVDVKNIKSKQHECSTL